MAEKKLPLKQVDNDALRAGQAQSGNGQPVLPFRVEPFAMEFQAGINPDKLNQLQDELEVEEFLHKMSR